MLKVCILALLPSLLCIIQAAPVPAVGDEVHFSRISGQLLDILIDPLGISGPFRKMTTTTTPKPHYNYYGMPNRNPFQENARLLEHKEMDGNEARFTSIPRQILDILLDPLGISAPLGKTTTTTTSKPSYNYNRIMASREPFRENARLLEYKPQQYSKPQEFNSMMPNKNPRPDYKPASRGDRNIFVNIPVILAAIKPAKSAVYSEELNPSIKPQHSHTVYETSVPDSMTTSNNRPHTKMYASHM